MILAAGGAASYPEPLLPAYRSHLGCEGFPFMSVASLHRAGVLFVGCSLLTGLSGCKPANPEKASAAEPRPIPSVSATPVAEAPPTTEVAAIEASSNSTNSTPSYTGTVSDPLDWPMWRGPYQDGRSIETGLVSKWEIEGPNVAWRNKELATRSTPIIMRGKLYTMARSEPETPREGERVVCADAETGKVLWENKWNVFLSDVPKERVAWSCVVGDPATGRVFAQSVNGYFQCIDGETGKTIWSRSLTEEFGLLSTYGGRTNTPIVFGDLVIANAVMTNWGELAVPAHRFVAFDKNTGEVIWFSGTTPRPADTTYSTPVTTCFDGTAAMVFGSGDGNLWAMQPRTGSPIWKYKMTIRGMNVTPLVDDGIVYMGQSEENYPDVNTMGQVAAIKGDAATDGKDITEGGAVWVDRGVMIGRSSMVKVGDRLYGADDSGNLYVMNAKTGEQIGKRVKLAGTIMRSSLLYADGKIYACTCTTWHVLEPTENGVKIVHRQRFDEGEEVHGSPIVSHGRLYLPTTEAMYCLVDPNQKSGVVPEDQRPKLPTEAALTDKTPAQVQLIPAESMTKPGEKVKYRVRTYNAIGQLLDESAKAKFTVTGPGQIADDGTYTADSAAQPSAVAVKAEVGSLNGTARLRVVPPLPWKVDFSDKEIPVTWIGMRYRHQIREIDGNPMMVKITTIPLGTKSRGWLGPDDLHNYTIQADVRAATANNKIPDVGLIAQRYTIDLMGTQQLLQIRSWDSELDRWSKTVPFTWKPETWYTIKFQASTEGSKAVLKGKVWERDQPEPAEWTIEASEDGGNLQGSPGMFGNATDAELFIDNVVVTKNS
ncbi:MAG TPA: PQQ-binding-like beta-propeller repeat protein [Pirellulales bacterium]|nr:PQQ-binding-like beta-propeller repeat protein [Pirellulales bacterium]